MLNYGEMRRTVLFLLLLLLPVFLCNANDGLVGEQAKQYRQEGQRLRDAGDLSRALVYFQKAAEMAPQWAQVHNDMGVIYEGMGDDNTAIKLYKKTLQLDKGFLAAYTNLALLYEKKNNIVEATYYWKKRYELGEKGEYFPAAKDG